MSKKEKEGEKREREQGRYFVLAKREIESHSTRKKGS